MCIKNKKTQRPSLKKKTLKTIDSFFNEIFL